MRKTLLFAFAVVALLTFAATAQAAATGCINCVYDFGWSCKLTQSNGGTSCTTTWNGCSISGSCTCTPLPSPFITEAEACEGTGTAAASAQIALPPETLVRIAQTDPDLAAALAELAQRGELVSPTRIYRTPIELSTDEAVRLITLGSDREGMAATLEPRIRALPADAEPWIYDVRLESDPHTLSQRLVVDSNHGDRLVLPLRRDFMLHPDVLTLDSP